MYPWPPLPYSSSPDHGQSVWIDFLSRPFVRDGDLEALVHEGVNGVTSNPDDLPGGDRRGRRLRRQLREVLKEERDPKEVFLGLAVEDIPRRVRHPPAAVGRGGRQRP
jgi:transaldolase